MAVAREETFGPVAPVLSGETDDALLKMANDCRYGLGASVWTKDVAKGRAMAAKIESGMVFVNGMVKSDPRMPFGGVKCSGYGRELGEEGIREFVNVKSVCITRNAG
jgi:succinate-semialdehyde dehydrogenase/glutarate-semialdehyde dehydrogenase